MDGLNVELDDYSGCQIGRRIERPAWMPVWIAGLDGRSGWLTDGQRMDGERVDGFRMCVKGGIDFPSRTLDVT